MPMITSPAKSDAPPDRTVVAALRRSLLRWYDRNARELLWRARVGELADPYHVLVSEAMLQQTQVATVAAYFKRFMDAFPTMQDLAEADSQAVLRLWQGLGYYRRALNLHRAAQQVVNEFDGELPQDEAALLTLPGVGRYTAGAIASIAFNRRAAILDGNVARVLARWFAVDGPIQAAPTRRKLWLLAESVVPASRPGDFNQAMMDLGAMICTPRDPNCAACPAARRCMAHRENRVSELPVTAPRKKPQSVRHHILAVEKNGRYLWTQRPSHGLWARLWQLPTAQTIKPGQLADWFSEQFGLVIGDLKRNRRFKHQTTHRTIQFTIWRARVIAGRLRPGRGVWRRLDQLEDLPIANPQRRAVTCLGDD